MFDFGKNWEDFSAGVLTDERLNEAEKSLVDLIGAGNLSGKSFLDIGCGTGIFSIAAGRLGAVEVTGIDVDERCISLSKDNSKKFDQGFEKNSFFVCSILDEESVKPLFDNFDIVYAWGSLHHTGDMKKAIEVAAKTVKHDGTFVIAIYNKHFTSLLWKYIKWFYNVSPRFIKTVMIYLFAIIIFMAKFAITGKNPLKQRRGMDFYYNVIDWVGGYPYEYATPDEIISFVTKMGFSLIKSVPAHVPTGCNEFVFNRLM